MTEKKLSQKERVFRAVIQLLGEKYDPSKNMAVYFYPVNPYKQNLPAPPPGFEEVEKMERQPDETIYETVKEVDCPVRGTVTQPVKFRRLRPGLSPEQEKAKAMADAYRKILALSKIEIQGFDNSYRVPFKVPGFNNSANAYFPENPLFIRLIELAGVPRSAVFDALRRDPRLNGGKKRKWKSKKKSNIEVYEELKESNLKVTSLHQELAKARIAGNKGRTDFLNLLLNIEYAHMLLRACGVPLENLPESLAKEIGFEKLQSSEEKKAA